MADTFTLTPEIVDAVIAHMNDDHADDNVVICRGVGGSPDVETATLVDVDLHAVTFSVTTPSGASTVRVPFERPLADRAQIRAEVADMFHRSEAMLA